MACNGHRRRDCSGSRGVKRRTERDKRQASGQVITQARQSTRSQCTVYKRAPSSPSTRGVDGWCAAIARSRPDPRFEVRERVLSGLNVIRDWIPGFTRAMTSLRIHPSSHRLSFWTVECCFVMNIVHVTWFPVNISSSVAFPLKVLKVLGRKRLQ